MFQRKHGALLACLGLALTAASPPVLARPLRWTSQGPEGAPIGELRIDPKSPATLYAVTAGGIYRSLDRARHWRAVAGPVASVVTLALDPRRAGTLYVGGLRGLFKSVDGGNRWRIVGAGLGNLAPRAMVIDPRDSSVLYVGTCCTFVGGVAADGVFKSSDGGVSFSRVIDRFSVAALALDPQRPDTVYAAAETAVLASDDGGGTWRIRGEELHVSFRTVAVDPQEPSILYAGTSQNGVFKSQDAGESWQPANAGLRLAWVSELVASASGLYAGSVHDPGLFVSVDGATTWQALDGLGQRKLTALVADPSGPARLYAGSFAGVFASDDGGASWAAGQIGLRSPGILALLAVPATNRVFAGGVSGFFSRRGTSGRWLSPSHDGQPTEVRELAAHPQTPATVFAVTGSGIAKTEDEGRTWRDSGAGLAGQSIESLAADPGSPTVLYAGGLGVFKSEDAGQSWVRSSQGLTDPVVRCLVVHAEDPAIVYAGTAGGEIGFFRSEDGGVHWQPAGRGLPEEPSMAALVEVPELGGRLFASVATTGFSGVFESRDRGAQWTEVQALRGGLVTSLVSRPRTGAVFVGTSRHGVLASRDGGETWAILGHGLSTAWITSLAWDGSGRPILHAGTASGVFSLQLSDGF